MDQDKERTIKIHLETLWKWEQIYWHQCARLKWLNHDDQNTAFFTLSDNLLKEE